MYAWRLIGTRASSRQNEQERMASLNDMAGNGMAEHLRLSLLHLHSRIGLAMPHI